MDKVEWEIDWRQIVITCKCGRLHEVDKDDLENCINISCGQCGRLISAHMDICISPIKANPFMNSLESKGE